MDPELLDEEVLDEEFLQKFLECDNADLDLQPPATQQQPPIPPLESVSLSFGRTCSSRLSHH